MEAIFDFIDDLTKRLNRPIKDLDDIRYVMAALKEIRESEIRIDMIISPVEVRFYLMRKMLTCMEKQQILLSAKFCNTLHAMLVDN